MRQRLLFKALALALFLSTEASAQTTVPNVLNWTDAANNETGFVIMRGNAQAGPFTELVRMAGANVVTFTDNVPYTEGQTWCYQVKYFNTAGDSPGSNVACKTFQVTPPNAPSGLTISALSTSQIQASWSDNSADETGFRLALKRFSPSTLVNYSAPADATALTAINLRRNKTYCATVYAVRSGVDSLPSNESCATTRR